MNSRQRNENIQPNRSHPGQERGQGREQGTFCQRWGFEITKAGGCRIYDREQLPKRRLPGAGGVNIRPRPTKLKNQDHRAKATSQEAKA